MTRSRSMGLALVAVLAVVVGGYLAYDNVLKGDAVAPLALPSASSAAVDPTAAASEDPATSADPAPAMAPRWPGPTVWTATRPRRPRPPSAACGRAASSTCTSDASSRGALRTAAVSISRRAPA